MREARQIPAHQWKEAERTDRTGKCLKDNMGHYFRQEANKVLHVADGIVNTLAANHIENSRTNFGDKYEECSNEEFQEMLDKQLNSFFE